MSFTVIDFCLMKYLKSDSSKNFTMLEMDWASKNNCKQRSGRAGRTANGRCYRMVTRKFYDVSKKKYSLIIFMSKMHAYKHLHTVYFIGSHEKITDARIAVVSARTSDFESQVI